MNKAEVLGLESATVLCERCHALNFTELLYPITTDINERRRPEILEWLTTVRNQQRCTFCSLVMSSLALDKAFSSTFAEQMELGPIKLHSEPVVVVRMANTTTVDEADRPSKKPGWQKKGHSFERTVMGIGVELEMKNTISRAGRETLRVTLMPMCTGEEQIYDRLLHYSSHPKAKLELSLIQRWVTSCKTWHQKQCSVPEWQSIASAGLRMIDLLDHCIVPIDRHVEYFALSYCWGRPTQIRPRLQLNLKTRGYLEHKGIFSEIFSSLPQTIQDAMSLTRDLGCRYLWIDALCIVQDDGPHKLSQIAQMDKIYSNATLTIVAAAGRDAWHGLPGLNEGTRCTRSLSRKVGDIRLLAQWPLPHLPSAVQPSWPWVDRAWTMQEQICSKRLLIFTGDEVIWECKSETLTEGAHSESASCCPQTTVSLYRNRINGMRPDPTSSPLQLYNYYMAGISTRKVEYKEDKLNCAAGLLNTLRIDLPSGFLWGLPIDFFDCAMLFHCGVWGRAPFERRDMFPSWCWAGQTSHARSDIAGPYDAGFLWAHDALHWEHNALHPSLREQTTASWIRKEVAFHYISEDETGWIDLLSTYVSEDESVFYRISAEKWQTNGPKELLVEAKARLHAFNVRVDHALAGFFQIAELDVDRVTSSKRDFGGRGGGTGMGYVVSAPSGQYICDLALKEDYRKAKPDKMTFILVAQHRRWERQLGPLFELLLIEQQGGLTSRIQIVRDGMLTLKLWEQTTARWEFVVLV